LEPFEKLEKSFFLLFAEKKGICTRKIIIDDFRKFSFAKIPPAANSTFFSPVGDPRKGNLAGDSFNHLSISSISTATSFLRKKPGVNMSFKIVLELFFNYY